MATRRSSTTLFIALAGAMLACVTACSSQAGPGSSGWPSTTSPVAADGLVWAVGNDVHLPDGTTITLDRPHTNYAVGGPGVWFTGAEAGSGGPNDLPPLRLATPQGVEELDAHPDIGSLMATSDGHWLAFLDRLDGGGGAAEAVVVDLTTGKEVVRSQEGLLPQETDGADFTDLYEDSPISLFGIVDDTLYVSGLSDLVTHDLTTGESASTEMDSAEISATDWYQELDAELPIWNDDHSWSILAHENETTPALESVDGERVTTTVTELTDAEGFPDFTGPPLEDWVLGGWLDEATAVALTPSGDDGSWRTPVLLTCTVPQGACEIVPGTEKGVDLPDDRPFGIPRS